jgi:radical SAM protein with 4Fe4S-binding SPASM domain
MMTKRTSFIIDPGGRLYRCGGLAGRTEFSFGTIGGSENDPYMGRELWRRCAACAYAPLCGDGCPFGAFVRWGDPLRLNCGKESLEHLVRENLKLSYLRKNRKQPQ